MKGARIVVVSLVAIDVAGCKSDSMRLADLLERSSSWLATAAAVGSTTAANRTPVRYADDTFEQAQRELKIAGDKLDRIELGPDIRANGKRLIDTGSRTIEHLRLAIDGHARDVSPEVALLSAQADSL